MTTTTTATSTEHGVRVQFNVADADTKTGKINHVRCYLQRRKVRVPFVGVTKGYGYTPRIEDASRFAAAEVAGILRGIPGTQINDDGTSPANKFFNDGRPAVPCWELV